MKFYTYQESIYAWNDFLTLFFVIWKINILWCVLNTCRRIYLKNNIKFFFLALISKIRKLLFLFKISKEKKTTTFLFHFPQLSASHLHILNEQFETVQIFSYLLNPTFKTAELWAPKNPFETSQRYEPESEVRRLLIVNFVVVPRFRIVIRLSSLSSTITWLSLYLWNYLNVNRFQQAYFTEILRNYSSSLIKEKKRKTLFSVISVRFFRVLFLLASSKKTFAFFFSPVKWAWIRQWFVHVVMTVACEVYSNRNGAKLLTTSY